MQRVFSVYFFVQGLLAMIWWGTLFAVPSSRRLFIPANFPDSALMSFVLSDIVLFVGGSFLSAFILWRDATWGRPIVFVHCGAAIYASLYCLAVPCLHHGQGWLSAFCMLPCLVACAGIACTLAPPQPRQNLVLETSAQIVAFWSLFLFVVPFSVCGAERDLGLSAYRFHGWKGLAMCIFAAASALGLSSAYVIVRFGEGTPCPLDPTQTLVTRGPYRFVRNPMAVAGISQAIAIGLFVGSPAIIAYSIAGGALWHLLIRPWEERELQKKFGDHYASYRNVTLCWIPRFWPAPATK